MIVDNTVTFKAPDGSATYDSVVDWGLVLERAADEQKPTGKWAYVDVPGAAGSIDLTRALSDDVPPNDRVVTLNFGFAGDDHSDAVDAVNAVTTAVHLQRMMIQTPDIAAAHLWYTGNCEIRGIQYIGAGVKFSVVCTCEPYKHGSSESTQTWDGIGSTPAIGPAYVVKNTLLGSGGDTPARIFSIGFDSASIIGDAGYNRLAFNLSRGENLFDLSRASMVGKTTKTDALNWVNSAQIKQQGQRVSFGGVSTSWIERAVITATNAKTVRNAGYLFPFALLSGLKCRIFFYCDAVTANIGTVTVDGLTRAAGATVYSSNVFNSQRDSGGVFPGGNLAGTLAAPSVGGSWAGSYVDFAVNDIGQIYIDIAGMTAPNVFAQVVFYDPNEITPANWFEPDMQTYYMSMTRPLDTNYTATGGGQMFGDSVTVGIATSTIRFYNTDLMLWDWDTTEQRTPEIGTYDAKYLEAVAVDSYGYDVYAGGVLQTSVYWATLVSKTLDAGSEPSYPVATAGDLDAYIEYNGAGYRVAAGEAVELPTLLSRGVNTVTSTAGYNSTSSTTTLSWRGGVL